MLSSYRSLLSAPGARPAFACKVLGVLPDAAYAVMLMYLVFRDSGSYASSGLVTGAAGFGVIVLTVPCGQWISRGTGARARAWRTWTLGVAAAAGFVAHVLISAGDVSVLWHAPVATVTAGCAPPFASMLRERWDRALAGDDLKPVAHAWENLWSEIIAVCGPLAAAAAVAVGQLDAWFVLCALMTLTATWLLVRVAERSEPSAAPTGAMRLVLTARRSWPALTAEGLSVAAWSALLFGAFAAAQHAGSPARGGMYAALISVGTAAGMVWFGTRTGSGSTVAVRTAAGMVAFAGFAVVAAAVPAAAVIAVACVLCGFSGALSSTCAFVWLDAVTEHERRLLMYQVLSVIAGVAGTTADMFAGTAAEHLPVWTLFAGAGALAAAASAVAFAGRRTLAV